MSRRNQYPITCAIYMQDSLVAGDTMAICPIIKQWERRTGNSSACILVLIR